MNKTNRVVVFIKSLYVLSILYIFHIGIALFSRGLFTQRLIHENLQLRKTFMGL
jgi:hypothetical protein